MGEHCAASELDAFSIAGFLPVRGDSLRFDSVMFRSVSRDREPVEVVISIALWDLGGA
ncbi:hypothetical protein CKA32_003307 [Geitlerinema sp. FC II]|nr:hypothetical protein CKA32_003307 [Geitlerinema sp. FC II]